MNYPRSYRGSSEHKLSPVQFVPLSDSRNVTQEQLNLFQRIIGACTSPSKECRERGHQLLSQDPRIQEVMPLLTPFIYKSMCINIAEEKLKFLIFIMRMISALLSHPTLNLDRYIHLLIPGPVACLLADQISRNPGADDHWAVRMFANIIVSNIVERYKCTESTVIESYTKALEDEDKPLATLFGAVIGLGKMGSHAIRQWLFPKVEYIAGRIEPYLKPDMEMSSVGLNTVAAMNICDELVHICGPVLAEYKPTEDEILIGAFAFLGLTEEQHSE
ncbi:transcription initiation factor TFIID subunit 6-like [Drosophila kikkawai]|uniref:Transcription initiation factor TFIID subunit 6-like n=1 Tax=Drosophila kikkawai TaxID=30033 RepID=A0ABM3C596_DROKI|nr:transcription initiation factor TFIID subunit 6-like [Drosophila kikkawai]